MNINKQGVVALIHNTAGQVLMLDHIKHNKLSLPGGKVDPGEDAIFAITRELYEETGITKFTFGTHYVELNAVTGVLFHVFVILTNQPAINKEPTKHRSINWVNRDPTNFKGKINRITFTALKRFGIDTGSEEYID